MSRVVIYTMLVFLGGCASAPPQYTYVNGQPHGQSNQNGGYQILPGLDAGTTGTLAGGLAGAAIGSVTGSGAAIQVLLGIGGALTGGIFGHQLDVHTNAIGHTDCNWSHYGVVDQNGNPSRTNSTWNCQGGNSIAGNRGLPPQAIPQ